MERQPERGNAYRVGINAHPTGSCVARICSVCVGYGGVGWAIVAHAFCIEGSLKTGNRDFQAALSRAADNLADNQSVRIQGLAQPFRERARRAEYLCGNFGGAEGGGCESAAAVGGVGVGVWQIGAGCGDAVVFVRCVFGVHGAHGLCIAQGPDGGQVVAAVAADGGVGVRRFQAACVGGKAAGKQAGKMGAEFGEGGAVGQFVCAAPVRACVVGGEGCAEAVCSLPCGGDVGRAGEGGFEFQAAFGCRNGGGLPAYGLEWERADNGGVHAACACAEDDVAA